MIALRVSVSAAIRPEPHCRPPARNPLSVPWKALRAVLKLVGSTVCLTLPAASVSAAPVYCDLPDLFFRSCGIPALSVPGRWNCTDARLACGAPCQLLQMYVTDDVLSRLSQHLDCRRHPESDPARSECEGTDTLCQMLPGILPRSP